MIRKLLNSFLILYIFSILSTGNSDSAGRSRSRENRRRDHINRGATYNKYGYGGRWFAPDTPRPKDTCPCVRRNDTGQCVAYDPRFQAVTVEEAILNFPDLQIDTSNRINNSDTTNPLPFPGVASGPPPVPAISTGTGVEAPSLSGVIAKSRSSGGKTVEPNLIPPPVPLAPPLPTPPPLPVQPSVLCGIDRECQDCSAALLNRLNGAGLLQGDELAQVSKKFGIQAPQRRLCDKYRFGRPDVSLFKRVPGGAAAPQDPAVDNLVKQLAQKGEDNWRKKHPANGIRSKRQSSSKQGSTLGEQFKIDCTKRGEPVESGSIWVGLCNVCWAWRKLPSSYFPQYVNELICDTDTKCMSGWGTCQQRYKTVDILQNTGTDANPTWKQVTISVANYCDCEVESGSGMHNFVAA